MKVLIPVTNENNEKKDIAEGFHKADTLCIFDCETNTYEWQQKSELVNLSSDLRGRGILSVIINDMPIMALRIFFENGLQVFKAKGTNLQENLNMFCNNQLIPFTTNMSQQKSKCGGGCDSCPTTCN